MTPEIARQWGRREQEGAGGRRGYQACASPSPACGLFIVFASVCVLFSLRCVSPLCVELMVTGTLRYAVMAALSVREVLMISAYTLLVRVQVV